MTSLPTVPHAVNPSEGGLEAPTRHPIDWRDDDFLDLNKVEDELRRVFDHCHGCRRCFNLCDAFPRLFTMIDESSGGEVENVDVGRFGEVEEACTLCDMCYMTKCPYVPPHPFNIDFPHLMLRHRAARRAAGQDRRPGALDALARIDANARIARLISGATNWATKRDNALTRPLMQSVMHIHRDAELPPYAASSLVTQARRRGCLAPPLMPVERPAEAAGKLPRRVVIFATCFANNHRPEIGLSALRVLERNHIEAVIAYPGCCGMPLLEQGAIDRVAARAISIAAVLRPWIDAGYAIITLVSSCGLMFRSEWPLIVPEDANVRALAAATRDIDHYCADLAAETKLADGMKPLDGSVVLQLACHSRAQNVGAKAAQLLRCIPQIDLQVIERCSGHGGTFGIARDTYDLAVKTGKATARKAKNSQPSYIASSCPLAAKHVAHGVRLLGEDIKQPEALHPIELIDRAYGRD